MKIKITFLLLALSACVMSFAQISASDFSVGAAGNYTMYKGDFQKSTPGVKVEVGYRLQQKLGYSLGFTKGFAIKSASSISSDDGMGNYKSTPSEIKTSFSTITAQVSYRFVGDEDARFGVYAPVGVSYVMAKFEEKPLEAIPVGYAPRDQMEPGSEKGFTINLGIGAMYKIGMPMIFAETGVALPANQQNDEYVENYIPLNIFFNVGVRIAFGTGGSK